MPAVGRSSTSLRDDVLARMGIPLLLLTALAVSLRPGLQSDTYWHMASGRWMVQEADWLRVDVFSWTVLGEHWVRPGLPADIVMYGLHEVGGAPLLVVAVAATFVAAFVPLFLTVRASPRVLVGVGVVTILTSVVSVSARPLVVALPLTAVSAVILDREQQSGRNPWLWALPVIAVAWVNAHGTFVVLFLLLGCHTAGTLIGLVRRPSEMGRLLTLRLASVGALSLLGTLVNPFGARMLLYPFEFAVVRVHRESISEWRQPLPSDNEFWPLAAMLAVSVFSLVRHRQQAKPTDVIVVAAFGVLALTAVRHSSIFAIAAYPHVVRLLSGGAVALPTPYWRAATPSERRIEAGILALLVALVLFASAPALTQASNDRATAEVMPIHTADLVVDSPSTGRLWNSFDVGGYVIWQGTPETLVSMDSRADLYGDDLVREHIAEWHAERDAPYLFPARGIDTVLVEHHAPLVEQLEDAGWTRVADDGFGMILQVPTTSTP